MTRTMAQFSTCVLQFLAFRLSEVKLSNEHLTTDLNMTMVSPIQQTSWNAPCPLSADVLAGSDACNAPTAYLS